MTQGKCRTCKYGEVYNDSWCRCQHPIIGGVRTEISDNCIAEEVIEVNRKYKERGMKNETIRNRKQG